MNCVVLRRWRWHNFLAVRFSSREFQQSVYNARTSNFACVHNAIFYCWTRTLIVMPLERKPLLQRPLDAFYFAYFVFHILTFICIDGQNFYPPQFVPRVLRQVLQDYLRDSGDPFVKGLQAHDGQYTWFALSMYSSLVFQNPVFVAGSWCLWRDDKRIYPVMAAYAILAACTTAQCLASVVYGNEQHILTDANKSMLLKSYIPFVAVPLVMLIDTTMRSIRLIEKAIAGETNTKKRQ